MNFFLENTSNILPPQARNIEKLRYKLLSFFQKFGYIMITPSLFKYINFFFFKKKIKENINYNLYKKLKKFSNFFLKIKKKKIFEIFKIATYLLKKNSIIKICYINNILYTTKTLNTYIKKEFNEIGIGIYGKNNLKFDIEIQELALLILKKIGILNIKVSLCHTEILKSIIKKDLMAKKQENYLSYLLFTKNIFKLKILTKNFLPEVKKNLLKVPYLYGNINILKKAKKIFLFFPKIIKALEELENLIKLIKNKNYIIDLSDFNNYYMYNGIIFNIYHLNYSNSIIEGGRYNFFTKFYKRIKSTVGFTINLKRILNLIFKKKKKKAIYAPWCNNLLLKKKILKLRNIGEIVIQNISHINKYYEYKFNRIIKFKKGFWDILYF
ncbi:ATP phosphoribosyltransferase regulatory subunit [Candidatus Zinderia endosymbiont of Aphrophora alni]|uniref:ATP phosphoribosyltransferase regulatory subunit n=1 Tax=Candidatus Zinderia endosymbiont of Aphrophora alni TaxID=3077951 RepID=UPI0030CAF64A